VPGEAVQPPAARTDPLGKARPSFIVSHDLPLDQCPDAYEHFDRREEGWTKVVLHPEQ
jgi:threonine dehydrogenase-like Zn-dependent dehydrogenase